MGTVSAAMAARRSVLLNLNSGVRSATKHYRRRWLLGELYCNCYSLAIGPFAAVHTRPPFSLLASIKVC